MNPNTSDAPQAAVPDPSISTPTNDLSTLFDQIAEKIIEQQEAIIGPIAVQQAGRVKELSIDWAQHDVDVNGDPKSAIDQLVAQYKELFGQIAVETCREAASKLLPQIPLDQQPDSLK